MTSRIFGQFLTPLHPVITLFITKALRLSSQNPWPPFSYDREVIYVRPLNSFLIKDLEFIINDNNVYHPSKICVDI